MIVGQSFVTVDSGSATVEDLVDKAFYGVKIDKAQGRLTVDRIVGDESIRLPDAYSQENDDYVNWLWTYNTFKFSWGTNGHIILEVL